MHGVQSGNTPNDRRGRRGRLGLRSLVGPHAPLSKRCFLRTVLRAALRAGGNVIAATGFLAVAVLAWLLFRRDPRQTVR